MNIGSRGASIVLFVASVALLLWTRPKFLVDPETNNWKPFGFGPGKTCLNITAIIILLALGTYLLSACIGTSLAKWKEKVSSNIKEVKNQQGGSLSPPPTTQQYIPSLPPVTPERLIETGGASGSGDVIAETFGDAFGPAFSLLN